MIAPTRNDLPDELPDDSDSVSYNQYYIKYNTKNLLTILFISTSVRPVTEW